MHKRALVLLCFKRSELLLDSNPDRAFQQTIIA
jgi:hypothetical protein